MRHVAIVLWLLAMPASASDWTEVAAPADGDAHYYDHEKLHLEGDAVTYWRKVEFRTPLPVRSALAQVGLYREQIDCGSREFRTLGYLHYAADGALIEDVYAPEAPPIAIAEGTPAHRMEALLCPRVATVPSEPVDELQRLRQEVEALQSNVRRLREGLGSQRAVDAAR